MNIKLAFRDYSDKGMCIFSFVLWKRGKLVTNGILPEFSNFSFESKGVIRLFSFIYIKKNEFRVISHFWSPFWADTWQLTVSALRCLRTKGCLIELLLLLLMPDTSIVPKYFTPEVLWSLKRVLGISLDKESSYGRNFMAPVKTGKLSILT